MTSYCFQLLKELTKHIYDWFGYQSILVSANSVVSPQDVYQPDLSRAKNCWSALKAWICFFLLWMLPQRANLERTRKTVDLINVVGLLFFLIFLNVIHQKAFCHPTCGFLRTRKYSIRGWGWRNLPRIWVRVSVLELVLGLPFWIIRDAG